MRKFCLLLAASFGALASNADAAIVVQSFNISATGFESGAPTETVNGSFTLTYDNEAIQFFPTSAGLTVAGLNIDYAGDALFTFNPFTGLMTVGNNIGFNSYTMNPSIPGFGFFLSNAATAPTITSFAYSANGRVWHASRIDVAQGAVPEPATWAMLIAGFALIGAALRSRRARRGVAQPAGRGRLLGV